MGNGEVRPATSYKTYDGTVRVGVDLAAAWRIDGRANGYRGRDIMTPGDLVHRHQLAGQQGSRAVDRRTRG